MRKYLTKFVSGALASVLAFGMAVTGTFGTADVQAAADKVLPVPVNFTGATYDTENWPEVSGTRIGMEIGDVETFSDKYSASCTLYIPKAALAKPSVVRTDLWLDLSQGERYLGNVSNRYTFLIVNDNGETFPVVANEKEQRELTESEYQNLFQMSEAGDFYKITIKDALFDNMLNPEGETEKETEIDTSQAGNVSMQIRVSGLFYKFSSLVYLDDIAVKANGSALFETDCSAASLHGRYYEYMLGEDKDENRKERPQVADLNTSLLKLGKSSASIRVGKTVQIKAAAAMNGKITYKSSNKKIAAVTSKGVVKGKKAGKATITVSANGISKTFKVTVKK